MNRTEKCAFDLAALLALTSCGGEGTIPPVTPTEPEPSRPTTVLIEPDEVVLTMGDTVRAAVRVLDQRARLISDAPFTLEVSDPSVVAVADDRGLVRGIREGRATLTVRSGTAAATAAATVLSADRRSLLSLFASTRGQEWTRRDGWDSDAPVGEWHGVSADGDGRVTALRLGGNGLRGALPRELGEMTRLVELRLDGNELVGPLPVSLSQLRLRTLTYGGTSLCVPAEEAFSEWLQSVPTREGPEEACVDERSALASFYRALNGRLWPRDDGWLSERPLGEWYGIETNEAGEVTAIELPRNGLDGEIPVELTEFASLKFLRFDDNRLHGPIPAWLGEITTLRGLYLRNNLLSGPIPPSLGRLTRLYDLELQGNDLTGDIPPELGSISGLTKLDLTGNRLEGSIPPELGRLHRLYHLRLAQNALSGPVPAELGSAETRWIETLLLSDNPALEGPLPESLAALPLEELSTVGTGLCAPRQPPFVAWLQSMRRADVAPCRDSPVNAYLTQAVQSLDFPVPLVAGKPALMRVFVASPNAAGALAPDVRATFFLDGAPVHEVTVSQGEAPIPPKPGEGDLALSANAAIPGRIVQPGLELVLEVDRAGALDPGYGVSGRWPATGRQAIEVRRVPGLNLTVIPLVPPSGGDDIIALVQSLHADHELFWHTRALLPVGELGVARHAPVTTTSTDTCELWREVALIRAVEGGRGHWLGIGYAGGGCAGIGERAAYSEPDTLVIAHELGHNMNLRHAPCGGPQGVDEGYPFREAATGAWGYDSRDGSLVPAIHKDLMSYCDPKWISRYQYANALRFRLGGNADAADSRPVGRQLLVSGRLDERGAPILDPAFVVASRPALPREGGPWIIEGSTADGRNLFRLRFEMPDVADHGRPGFVFAIPADPAWARELATISLDGPGGTVVMGAASEPPMAILRDPASGEVRAILRDAPAAQLTRGAAGEPYARLDVMVSRGLPNASVGRRY